MPAGIETTIVDGVAEIVFSDPEKTGTGINALIEAGGNVERRTSGTRDVWVVSEEAAVKAGLVDAPHRKPGRPRIHHDKT